MICHEEQSPDLSLGCWMETTKSGNEGLQPRNSSSKNVPIIMSPLHTEQFSSNFKSLLPHEPNQVSIISMVINVN